MRAQLAGLQVEDEIVAINGAVAKPKAAASAVQIASIGGGDVELRVVRGQREHGKLMM
jgi:C-terminal processing protease CtpA/Prc